MPSRGPPPCSMKTKTAADLGAGVQAADLSAVHIAGDEADAPAMGLGVLLQPLDEGVALLQVDGRVPVILQVVQQGDGLKPAVANQAM